MDTNAESYSNSESLEMAWAVRAYEEAELHYNIITSVDASSLKLCENDDAIYNTFREMFPDFDVAFVSEDDLKNESAKKEWRNFCNKFEKFNNFNFGSLLRKDPMLDYSAENTIFATRIQYLAIEISRNREGISRKLFQKQMQAKKVNKDIAEAAESLERTAVTT